MFFPEFPANQLRNLLSQKLSLKLEKLRLQTLSNIDLIPQKNNLKSKTSNLQINQSIKTNLKPIQSLNSGILKTDSKFTNRNSEAGPLQVSNLKNNSVNSVNNPNVTKNKLINENREYEISNRDYYSSITSKNKTRLVQITKLTDKQMRQFDFPLKGNLEGQVLETFNNKLLPVTLKGKTVVAENPQNIQFNIGKNISLKIQNVGTHFKFVVSEKNSLDTYGIQSDEVKNNNYFDKLNKEISIIKNQILNVTSSNKDIIESQLFDRIQKILNLFKPKDPISFKAEAIQKAIAQSGINYEAKVKELLFENSKNKILENVKNDLKGQLLDLKKKIQVLISKETIPESTLVKIKEFQTQVRQSIQGIEQQQLNQFVSKQENQSFLLPFVDNLMGKDEKIKIYFRSDQQEGKSEKQNQKEFSLIFLLELTNLGNLRIDSKIKNEQIDIKITGEGLDIVEFINSQISEFTDQMESIGFNISVSTTVQNQIVLNFPESHQEIKINDINRLIDIRT